LCKSGGVRSSIDITKLKGKIKNHYIDNPISVEVEIDKDKHTKMIDLMPDNRYGVSINDTSNEHVSLIFDENMAAEVKKFIARYNDKELIEIAGEWKNYFIEAFKCDRKYQKLDQNNFKTVEAFKKFNNNLAPFLKINEFERRKGRKDSLKEILRQEINKIKDGNYKRVQEVMTKLDIEIEQNKYYNEQVQLHSELFKDRCKANEIPLPLDILEKCHNCEKFSKRGNEFHCILSFIIENCSDCQSSKDMKLLMDNYDSFKRKINKFLMLIKNHWKKKPKGDD
jgi:hypothetical protein